MKKCIFSVIFMLICNIAMAQRLAYVDSDYILQHVPEYSSAQKQLDALSAQWQRDIDKRFVEVEGMYKTYQADQVLLTEDMRRKREQEIAVKEKEAKDLQQKRFGYEGELYLQRLKLIKPIQEKIGKAIEEYASREGLDIIIDKNSVTMLYARSNYDRSNDIITRLGYKPGSFAK
jgi:outer membrane protein